VPVLGLVFSGWYFFYKYITLARLKDWYMTAGIFLLVGLLKPTALIGWIAMMVLYVADVIFKKNLFKHKKTILITGLLLIVIIIGWRSWSTSYNLASNSRGFFLDTIMPLWDMNHEQQQQITNWIIRHGLQIHVYQKISLQILLAVLMLNFLLFFRQQKLLFVILILNMLGIAAVIILWYQQLMVHDYYYIEWLILPVMNLICFFGVIKSFELKFTSLFSGVLLSIFLAFNVYHTSQQMHYRYETKEEFYTGMNFSFLKTAELHDFFKKMGVSHRDTVLSVPDNTPNGTLYWMHLRGYTNYNASLLTPKATPRHQHQITTTFVNELVQNYHCKYLIINKLKSEEADTLNPYMNNLIGVFDSSIYVYRLN
jgi:hypothetical protein